MTTTTTDPPLLHPHPPTPTELHSFLQRHLDLLSAERQAEIEQTNLLASACDVKLLEKRGLALGGLGVSNVSIGLGGKTMIELHRPSAYHNTSLLPPHTFRNGDPARIEPYSTSSSSKKAVKGSSKKSTANGKEDGEDEEAVEGVVAKVTQDMIVISVDGNKSVDLPERLTLLKLANSATFDRMDQTILRLAKSVLGGVSGGETSINGFNSDLISVLFGLSQPTTIDRSEWDISLPDTSGMEEMKVGLKFFDETLNESQEKAVEFALGMREVAAIHGPPGTGKTVTLVEIIRQLVLVQKKKVLVCGASNLAVDNLLTRLSPLFPPGALLRLGHPARISRDLLPSTLDYQTTASAEADIVKDVKNELEGSLRDLGKKKGEKGWLKGRDRGKKWADVRELRKEYRVREENVVKNVVAGAQVVLSTCHGAGSRQIQNLNFDVCVIDEATQAVEAVCWIPVLKAKKLILAGDPLQLPPTILSSNQKASTNKVKGRIIPSPGSKLEPEQPSAATAAAPATVDHPIAPIHDKQVVEEKPELVPTPTESESTHVSPAAASTATSATRDVAPTTTTNATTTTHQARDIEQAGNQTSSDEEDEDEIKDKQLEDGVSKLKLGKLPRPRLKPPRTLETTLFDRLETMYGPGIKRMLTVQYRMNEAIATFPSDAVYLSKLVSAPSVAKRRLIELPTIKDPESEDAKDVLSETLVFFDTADAEMYERTEGDSPRGGASAADGSRYNENEAEVVCMWAKKLIDLGVPASEIAIITPYQAQVAHIAALLRVDYPDLIIGSVDGMQGQEREAVILSLVRSNANKEVGFLAEHRRLNVAMTRAKRQLCIVGDSSTVGKGSKYLKSWMQWLEEHADVRWAGPE